MNHSNPFAELHESIEGISRKITDQLIVIEKAPQKEVLTFRETCEFLGVADNTLYMYVSKRKIPYSKKFSKLYFSREKLIKWLLTN